MRKLLALLIVSFALSSCDNTPSIVENQKKETSIELIELAAKDTVLYKVVEKDNTIYCIDSQQKLVKYKVENNTGAVLFLSIMLFVFFIILVFIAVINT